MWPIGIYGTEAVSFHRELDHFLFYTSEIVWSSELMLMSQEDSKPYRQSQI
jgi:hypothetical protein